MTESNPHARMNAAIAWTVHIGMLVILLLALYAFSVVTQPVAASLPGIASEVTIASFAKPVAVTLSALSIGTALLVGTDSTSKSFKAGLGNLRRQFRRHSRNLLRALGLRSYPLRQVLEMILVGVLAGIGLASLGIWLVGFDLPAGWVPEPDDPRIVSISDASPLIRVLHAFMYAPLSEELAFRGPLAVAVAVAASGPARRHLPASWRASVVALVAVVMTVLFATLHAPYNALNVLLAGCIGAVTAVLTIRYRSILPGIVVHAVYNSLVAIGW